VYEYNNGEYWGGSDESSVTPVVRWLLIANVLIYFGMLILSGIFYSRIPELDYNRVVGQIGFVPFDALEHLYLWQFVTYGFVHAKMPFHLLFNMYILWWAGTEVERHIGSREFFWLFFLAIIVSAMAHVPFAYLISGEKATPVIGASGAIMTLLILFAGFFPDRKLSLFFIFGPFSARTLVIAFVVLDLVWLLSQETQIAAAVHLGGAAFGFVYLKSRTKIERFFDNMRRRLEEEERTAQRNLKLDLDNVLRKIKKEGMESLTHEEKSILNKASKHYRDNDPPA
jgi:membrane associated rhomboid family serine protease